MNTILSVLTVLGEETECVKTAILGSGGQYCGGIYGVLAVAINILTYGIATAGVIGIVIAGVQYITSSGDPATMTRAKNRIVQVVIGLVVWGLMWAFLEWLIPGGVL